MGIRQKDKWERQGHCVVEDGPVEGNLGGDGREDQARKEVEQEDGEGKQETEEGKGRVEGGEGPGAVEAEGI